MTSSMPSAMTTMKLFCRIRLVRLSGSSNLPPVTTWKNSMIATSDISMPYSRRFPPLGLVASGRAVAGLTMPSLWTSVLTLLPPGCA